MATAVAPLAAAMRADVDRYVRAHAAEALACAAMLAACDDASVDEAARAAPLATICDHLRTACRSFKLATAPS